MGERSEKEKIVLVWRSDQNQESSPFIFQKGMDVFYPEP
jgi:hypothetical protein